MMDTMLAGAAAIRQAWARAMMEMVWSQWLVVDTGFRATREVLATAGGLVPGADTAPGGAAPDLAARAACRVQAGLAPPREVYDVTKRSQVDWLAWPSWARPSDPEMFEGTAREG